MRGLATQSVAGRRLRTDRRAAHGPAPSSLRKRRDRAGIKEMVGRSDLRAVSPPGGNNELSKNIWSRLNI